MKNARTRLALIFLAVIMVLSLGFSVLFYHQSIHEAKANLQRQQSQLSEYLYFTNPRNVQRIQAAQLKTFQENLMRQLVILNLLMLVMGGALSYLLAKRSLLPLEEMLVSQSRFTSDAAHELRTPLTAMKTELEVNVRSKKISTAEAKIIMKSSLEEVAKLETLTAALLRLAKSSEKIDKTYFKSYNIKDILHKAYSRLEDKALARHINIKLPRSGATVYGDADQLVELFVPLLGNAIKYSHEKSDVTVTVKKSDQRVWVFIEDQGIGIADVDLPHIFDRFYRADQSRNKTAADGYGLGLSLAKAIADAHEGKISVKSEYGKGSTFIVELPSIS